MPDYEIIEMNDISICTISRLSFAKRTNRGSHIRPMTCIPYGRRGPPEPRPVLTFPECSERSANSMVNQRAIVAALAHKTTGSKSSRRIQSRPAKHPLPIQKTEEDVDAIR